uniref:vesicular integral-membrane protein VIP36-like n=1 Tax=Myxine glutinosa TaxID=7769 RepID=UPI00358E608A
MIRIRTSASRFVVKRVFCGSQVSERLHGLSTSMAQTIVTCVVLVATLLRSVHGDQLRDPGVPGQYMKREFSLVKPYQGVGAASSLWDIAGSVIVTSNHLRLTSDHQSQQGAVWNTMPSYVTDWELQVHFKLHGSGKKGLHGDGFAIWYAKEKLHLGTVFGSVDMFSGLGVLVDTYKNDFDNQERSFPYISIMVNNGSLKYDHGKDGKTTEIAGCYADVRNKNFDTFLSIRFSKRRLTVMLNADNHGEWKECADIMGVHLPTGYYFGASATTGDLSDNHDIIFLKLFELTVPPDSEPVDYSKVVPSVDSMQHFHDADSGGAYRGGPMTGWNVFLLLLCSLLGIVVCAIVGVVVFQKHQEQSRKRFY